MGTANLQAIQEASYVIRHVGDCVGAVGLGAAPDVPIVECDYLELL